MNRRCSVCRKECQAQQKLYRFPTDKYDVQKGIELLDWHDGFREKMRKGVKIPNIFVCTRHFSRSAIRLNEENLNSRKIFQLYPVSHYELKKKHF